MQECINFHLIIGDKRCYFIALYQSPNRCHDKFNSIIKSLELNLDKATNFNPFLIVVLDYFKAKSCNLCINAQTDFEGGKMDTLTSQNGLHHIIKEATYILDTSSSCVDLFFTSQSKLDMDSGVNASLYVNCHHQIIYSKSNLQIYHSPPYERVVWPHKQGNTNHIRKAICDFNWLRFFANKDVKEMVNIFNETISNVLINYIHHETIICDDQDPTWVNIKIKKAMLGKNQLFSSVKSNNNNGTLLKKLQCLQDKLNDLIDTTKEQYYTRISKKLMDPTSSAKTYWSI